MAVELRHLRYFVAIAEHGSISRAARSVYVAQPALTKQLRDLEEELGVTLFERRARGIELTPGGRQFLADARGILEAAALAKERAIRVSVGQVGSLSIGMTVLHTLLPIFLRIMHTFRSARPGVSISLRQLLSGPQVEGIRSEELDAGMLFFRPTNDESLMGMVVHQEPLVLAVPRDSAWVKVPPHRLSELATADFIWFPRSVSPDYHDQLIYCFRKAGFTPRVTQEGTDNSSLLSLVAAGLGCTILPAAARMGAPDSVVFMTLDDLDVQLPLELVWRSDNHSPLLHRFIEVARACSLGV
ncbi:DNA-binding transcriptional LysR family regulator OS=Castellaniella defragrans OX=75697 GN=HNR28_000607 PE=3 SV=1 [Castellaniella defragrans]